ncbi:hypothetical protein EJ06DRAFT_479360 [Trichodelitschia bisporula]|uniref:Uncharacterized protein n=1 Tax=Trichodelitschia bisporula TaxID=703511 RepID=A0A6G1HT18_9PEZI|nr:hypothetical protein EJ06DRAFT_479360 [Trichodelitschia bisporula]
MEVAPRPFERVSSSRRSFPNLTHLSLAPLSSRFPIDDEGYEPDPQPAIPSTYIQGKSAPATPSILSRSPTRRRRHKKHIAYALDSYFPPAESPSHTKHASSSAARKDDDWIHRAGLVIAYETRSSKGQSWLVTRNSSTSLADETEPGFVDPYAQQKKRALGMPVEPLSAVDDDGLTTPRLDRNLSRGGSRPDFVDKEEEESSAGEDEVAQLTRQTGFGLGGLVDRLVGWSLFDLEEREDTTDDEADEETDAEVAKRRDERAKQRKEALEQASRNAAVHLENQQAPRPADDEGGWNDAAWLMSVASKVLW